MRLYAFYNKTQVNKRNNKSVPDRSCSAWFNLCPQFHDYFVQLDELKQPPSVTDQNRTAQPSPDTFDQNLRFCLQIAGSLS